MLPKGKLAVFVIPATEKDILMKIASDEAEVDSAEQDSFFYILFLLRSVFQINWPPKLCDGDADEATGDSREL